MAAEDRLEALKRRLGQLDDELREANVRLERAEKLAAARRRVYAAIWRMRASGDMEKTLAAVGASLRELGVDFDHCGVNVLASGAVEQGPRSYMVDRSGRWRRDWLTPGAVAVVERIWRSGSISYRRDLLAEDANREVDDMHRGYRAPIRSVVDVPFSQGTLAVNSTAPEAFGDADLEMLQEMAQVLSDGLVRVVDFATLERRNLELEEHIAERGRAEKALQEANRRYAALFEGARDAIVIIDADTGTLLDVNAAGARLLGRSHDELVGVHHAQLVRAEHRPRQERGYQACIERADHALVDIEVVTADGRPVPVEVAYGLVRLDDGRRLVQGVFRDVTERRQALRQLEFQSTLLDEIRDFVTATDLEGRITYVNRAECELFGRSREEMMGAPVAQYGEDPRAGATQQEIIDGTRRHGHWRGEVVNVLPDGQQVVFDSRTWLIRDDQGQATGLCGISTDISERKRIEEALRDSEARYRTLYETMEQGVLYRHRDGRLISANPAAERILGLSLDEMRGAPAGDSVWRWVDESGAAIPADELPAAVALRTGRVAHHALVGVYHPKRQEYRWVQVNAVPQFRDGQELPHQVYATFTDVTDQRRMEEELRRIHNLESLGLLAGGIAHDFNNILTGVTGNLALLLRLLPADSEENAIAAEASQAATRTRDLTQQLMTFARGGAPVKETASAAQLLEEVTRLSLRGSNTRAVYHLAEDLWSVEVDPRQIGQVIQNLIINADQAMPQGGELTVTADNATVTRDDRLPIAPGRYVRVRVDDRGVGIPETVIGRIFDPYFSTKQSGHGLGLAICHSIVSRHEGHISVESRPGEGTRFTLYLPASTRSVGPADVRGNEPPATGSGRILLMDDEDLVRNTVSRMLRRLGYSVDGVDGGEAALEAYAAAARRGEPYDAVIVDLTVPGGMGGREAAAALHRIDPGARLVVASGYSNDPVLAQYREHGFRARIAKPVDLRQLGAAVRQALNDPH